jgi:hypothetical protein
MGLPLYVICFFTLTAFNIISRVSVIVVLIIICCGIVLFWSGLFGVLEVPVPVWAYFFLDLGNFLLLFFEYITHSFCLHLFSFFNAHDL